MAIDRKVFHDGFTNKISFNFHGHKVILKSLSPKEVHEDQVKMREKREKEKDIKNSKRSLLISSQQVKKVIVTHKPTFFAIPRPIAYESAKDSDGRGPSTSHMQAHQRVDLGQP